MFLELYIVLRQILNEFVKNSVVYFFLELTESSVMWHVAELNYVQK